MHFVIAALSPRSFTIVVDGVPAGVRVRVRNVQADVERAINAACERMERAARVGIAGGLSDGRTTGAPVSMRVDVKAAEPDVDEDAVRMLESAPLGSSVPRPGQPDLYAALKVDSDDVRETSTFQNETLQLARVAAAAVAREFLAELGVDVQSYTTAVGPAVLREENLSDAVTAHAPLEIETSPVRCPVAQASRSMVEALDDARESGDTLGGAFRVVATGVVAGLGSHADPSLNLSSQMAAAVMGVPDVLGVELGQGFAVAALSGRVSEDPVRADRNRGFVTERNLGGGIECGISTGMPIVLSAAVRPVPPQSGEGAFDMDTLEPTAAPEPLFVCAVPARAVAAESAVALVLANAYFAKFGADSLSDIRAAVDAYRRRLKTASR